ncbi:MAG: hypothetical protein JNL51_17910 [Chitinophagaceae bacterium]|nr:hypothetical protein [Chitinophagaceae bacterium]
MKKLISYVCIAACSALFISCKSSNILSANFEADAIGQPPATNLSGAPDGDVIQFNPGLIPQLKVQNSIAAGEKALHLMNFPVNLGPHNRWIGFRSIGTNLASTIWFMYTAKNTNPSGNVMIDIADGAGCLMTRMRIHSNGEVRLAKNLMDNYTDLIGNIGQNKHTVIFTTSPSTLKYNVTILQTGGEAITAENKPMITENALEFANPAHPSISFSHASTGSGDHHYVIESVTISKKKPN